MPRLRKPTAAEMAALNALHYDFIGGPPPPAPAPKKKSVLPDLPVNVFVLVGHGNAGGAKVLAVFDTLAQAMAAAEDPRTRAACPDVTVETEVLRTGTAGWSPGPSA